MKRIRFERIMAVAFALIVALQLMAQGDAQVTVVKVKGKVVRHLQSTMKTLLQRQEKKKRKSRTRALKS